MSGEGPVTRSRTVNLSDFEKFEAHNRRST